MTDIPFHQLMAQPIERFRAYEPRIDQIRPFKPAAPTITDRTLHHEVEVHDHQFVHELMQRLIEGRITRLQDADTDDRAGAPALPDGAATPELWRDFFSSTYAPAAGVTTATTTGVPSPVDELDFSTGGAYSAYNWELFYHVPLTIGIHLSKNQRYAEARRWFHFIFDPTDDSDGPTPQRFWKFRPFRATDAELVESLIASLSSTEDTEAKRRTIDCIEEWTAAPFRPHLVARYRPTAYRYKAVMAYLDNLIAWGDDLFSSDLTESITEAVQYYVLAAEILGPRPQEVPSRGKKEPKTYNDLRTSLNEFGDALTAIETTIPFDGLPLPGEGSTSGEAAALQSVGTSLYFCVPRNAKLIGYWDTVADRLYKIRNSLNILGVFRQLPLFDPPIDPAMLARAVAAGVNVSAIVNGSNQPLPLVRYSLLAAKAVEICQDVKGLGAALLAAIEKQDSEALTLLRARHEKAMFAFAESVKYAQVHDAIKAREASEKGLATAVMKYTYYEQLLGNTPADPAAGMKGLERSKLDDLDFGSVEEEPTVTKRTIVPDIATDVDGATGGKLISSGELHELVELASARTGALVAEVLDGIAAGMNAIPSFSLNAHPFGVGGSVSFGGSNLGAILTASAAVAKSISAGHAFEAGNAAKMAGYARRQDDWAHQSNLAAAEIDQVLKQLRGAQLREYIAYRELHNHQAQMAHAEEINAFLDGEKSATVGHTRTTTLAFHTWMRGEVRGLYKRCFDLALDIARKAERALQHELGDDSLTFIDVGYMGGQEGLLAGERLLLDLRRMDLAYLEHRQREYEMTRHVSMAQLDPKALLELRATGSCQLSIPESLLCFDTPGHYFARIKSVAVSIPSVAGPYAGVRCSLRLLKSRIRTDPSLAGGAYAYDPENDDDTRFDVHYSSLEAIVTSTGQNDAGLFEVNLHDERYLPFEGHGVVSDWQIDLPSDFRQFDYDSISDLILHVRYTAREGGEAFAQAASTYVGEQISDETKEPRSRLLSVATDFATAWAAYKQPDAGNGAAPTLQLDLRNEHYPYWAASAPGRLNSVVELRFYARVDAGGDPPATTITLPGAPESVDLDQDDEFGGMLVGTTRVTGVEPVGPLTLTLSHRQLSDLWVVVKWI